MNLQKLIVILWSIQILMSCQTNTSADDHLVANTETDTTNSVSPISDSTEVVIDTIKTIPLCSWDEYLNSLGLVNIKEVIPSIVVDLRYSTQNNFMERDMYGCLENCYLQPDVADRLLLCQQKLKSIDSTLTLLVYDGVRPRLVQQYMWDLLDMPINEKVKFVSNPTKGSLHNFGAAVDISIYDLTSETPLDMGTPYDYMGVLAWPTKEAAMLKDSLLTQQQVDNRILLRKVLKEGKFFNIQTEWWHFNACYRDKAKELYQMVEGDSNLIFNQN